MLASSELLGTQQILLRRQQIGAHYTRWQGVQILCDQPDDKQVTLCWRVQTEQLKLTNRSQARLQGAQVSDEQ